jgi:hypothetical protein
LDSVKRLLLALLVLAPLGTTNASTATPQCPGTTTVEMRDCAARSLEQSNTRLQSKLPKAVFVQWQQATRAACAKAHANYKDGSIYPQLVVSCDDQLNRALLKQFQALVN